MARRRKSARKAAPKSRRKARRSKRGLRGLASLGNPRSAFMQSGVPALVATIVTSGVAIGLRVALSENIDTDAKKNLVKYAPAIGAAAGLAASGAFFALSGAPAAAAAAVVSLANAAALMASDKLTADKPAILAAIASTPAAPNGVGYMPGLRGFGAIVPETNLGAILMEQNRGGLIGMGATVPHAGEIVDLRGTVNPSAFGQ